MKKHNQALAVLSILVFLTWISSYVSAQTNSTPVVQVAPATVLVASAQPTMEQKFNSFTMMWALAGAWLVREIMGIGSMGGIKGIGLYIWAGIKPSQTTQLVQLPQTSGGGAGTFHVIVPPQPSLEPPPKV